MTAAPLSSGPVKEPLSCMPLLDGFQTQIHGFLAKANICNAMQSRRFSGAGSMVAIGRKGRFGMNAGLPPNKAPQFTVDPPPNFAAAKTVVA